MGVFGFTCSFEFDDSDVGDIGSADVEDENTNVNIANTTNNNLLGFENASELSDMQCRTLRKMKILFQRNWICKFDLIYINFV